MYRIAFILLVLITFSCGTSRQLKTSYLGKSIDVASKKFGPPITIVEKKNEKIYVFEVDKKLEGTEISQGKLTLDPIITPQVNKTERYFFTVIDSTIVKTKYEEEYER